MEIAKREPEMEKKLLLFVCLFKVVLTCAGKC